MQTQQGWPVLTYHLIDPDLQDRNSVTPAQFSDHLDGLLKKGFVFPSVDELSAILPLKDDSQLKILLTIDDAYATTLEYAFPRMSERNIHFLLFVPVDYVSKNNLWNPKARYVRQHLSWDDLRFLQKELGTIGSHACTHQSLVKFDSCRIEDELIQSKTVLESKLGSAIRYIAYPYGDTNAAIEQIASKHYHLGFSATQGDWSWKGRRWAINRILIDASDDVTSILQKIQRYYGIRGKA